MPEKLSLHHAALLQLAKLVANDLARGTASTGLQAVGLALSETPEAVQILLDLLLAEAKKKRPSDRLIRALVFMVGEALSETRMALEADPRGPAATLVADVRSNLLAAPCVPVVSAAIHPPHAAIGPHRSKLARVRRTFTGECSGR